jgi:diguanylate cyclase (GGDEF)-like protein
MIEPLATNRAALGFDLASEPRRLSALLQALETDRMVATAGITLVQEPNNQRGILVFSSRTLPGTQDALTISDERMVFVNGVFRVGELVNQSIGSRINDQMQVRVIDQTRDATDILYSRLPDGNGPWLTDQRVVHVLPDVAGRQWSYEVVPAESLFADRRSFVPWLVFGSGSVVVVLLVIYVLVTHRQTEALNDAKAQLERISLTDSLTGLANRRHFDQHLEQQWAQAVREKKSVSLIMMDIDNFKPYNDEYGHPEGDAALEEVARALRNVAIRPMDLVTRYGGEEFAVILPSTEDPLEVAQACRRSVAALALHHGHSDVAPVITISAGVCTLKPVEGYSCDQLIEWADEALYRAKEDGRNRVVVYSAQSGFYSPERS